MPICQTHLRLTLPWNKHSTWKWKGWKTSFLLGCLPGRCSVSFRDGGNTWVWISFINWFRTPPGLQTTAAAQISPTPMKTIEKPKKCRLPTFLLARYVIFPKQFPYRKLTWLPGKSPFFFDKRYIFIHGGFSMIFYCQKLVLGGVKVGHWLTSRVFISIS